MGDLPGDHGVDHHLIREDRTQGRFVGCRNWSGISDNLADANKDLVGREKNILGQIRITCW